MADKLAAAEIAALGRLCGIAPEYCDNFGGRHPTSPDTFRALLSAMGVPWEEPDAAARGSGPAPAGTLEPPAGAGAGLCCGCPS